MSWEKDIQELKRREKLAEIMGGEEKLKRQKDNNRLNVRERINLLFDKNSFHEFGKIAGKAKYDEKGDLINLMVKGLLFPNYWLFALPLQSLATDQSLDSDTVHLN